MKKRLTALAVSALTVTALAGGATSPAQASMADYMKCVNGYRQSWLKAGFNPLDESSIGASVASARIYTWCKDKI